MKRQTKVTEIKKSEEGEEEAMKGQKGLTRREMLKLSAAVGAGSLLVACGPTVTSTVASTGASTPIPPTVAPTAVPPTVAPTIVSPTSAPVATAAAGPVTLELPDPTGALEVTQLFSARLDDLAGKTICEVSNSSWEAARTFPLIRELLQKQFPTAKIIPYTEFTMGSNQIGNDLELGNKLKAAGCQAAIVGNAG